MNPLWWLRRKFQKPVFTETRNTSCPFCAQPLKVENGDASVRVSCNNERCDAATRAGVTAPTLAGAMAELRRHRKCTIGAVVISRHDGYGGDQPAKATYCLTSLIQALDEVIYVDWNSPDDMSLMDVIRDQLPKTGRLRHIQITQAMARTLVNNHPDAQLCVEVLARNIGLRRLTSEYRISTNGDVMALDRESVLSGIQDARTFHCIARRETPFPKIRTSAPGSEDLRRHLRAEINQYPQHPDGSPVAGDRWSLITCPGDFQLAHRDVWNGIRGYEEELVMRGYTDSNVQRKAEFYGYSLALVRAIPAFHFQHYPGTGGTGGTTNPRWNDADKSLWKFKGTTNPETWGFADQVFKEEVI